jgi:hypothetical protein
MASRSPLAFLASFLLLAASLVNFLMYDKYPMLRPEIFAAFLALALFCALMAFIYARVGIWGRRLLDVLLIAFVIDLNVDSGWWPVLGACAYFLISLRLKEAPHQFLAIFGGFVMISSMIGIGERQPWLSETKPAQKDGTVASNRPAIIHILLDEHIGVGGFHKTESGMRTAAQTARVLYPQRLCGLRQSVQPASTYGQRGPAHPQFWYKASRRSRPARCHDW